MSQYHKRDKQVSVANEPLSELKSYVPHSLASCANLISGPNARILITNIWACKHEFKT